MFKCSLNAGDAQTRRDAGTAAAGSSDSASARSCPPPVLADSSTDAAKVKSKKSKRKSLQQQSPGYVFSDYPLNTGSGSAPHRWCNFWSQHSYLINNEKNTSSAQARYQALAADRQQFLDTARSGAKLTLPYLITEEGTTEGGGLHTPWQSVGAKGTKRLGFQADTSSPINTSFFKLQLFDAELMKLPELTPEIRSEIDLSLSKMERIVMQQISETSDRVQLHAAMKHLVVTGNALVYAGKKALKVYPLDRYVTCRDGDWQCH